MKSFVSRPMCLKWLLLLVSLVMPVALGCGGDDGPRDAGDLG